MPVTQDNGRDTASLPEDEQGPVACSTLPPSPLAAATRPSRPSQTHSSPEENHQNSLSSPSCVSSSRPQTSSSNDTNHGKHEHGCSPAPQGRTTEGPGGPRRRRLPGTGAPLRRQAL